MAKDEQIRALLRWGLSWLFLGLCFGLISISFIIISMIVCQIALWVSAWLMKTCCAIQCSPAIVHGKIDQTQCLFWAVIGIEIALFMIICTVPRRCRSFLSKLLAFIISHVRYVLGGIDERNFPSYLVGPLRGRKLLLVALLNLLLLCAFYAVMRLLG